MVALWLVDPALITMGQGATHAEEPNEEMGSISLLNEKRFT